MKFKKSDFLILGEGYNLAKTAFLVLDNNFCIRYANQYAELVFYWDNENAWIGKSFNTILQQLGVHAQMHEDNNRYSLPPIKIRETYRMWDIIPVLVDSKRCYFLLDKDVTQQEETNLALQQVLTKVTGQTFIQNLSTSHYLKEIQNCWESIILQMPCYVYWKDKNFKYLFCNELTSREVLGLSSPKEIIGKTDYDFGWDPKQVDEYRKVDEEILRTGIPRLGFEETVITDNGKIFNFLVNKMPLLSSSGDIIGVIGITVDITSKKEAEALKLENEKFTLQKSKLELERLEFESQMSHKLLEEQRMFTTVISQSIHDIGSPIASLISLSKDCREIPEDERIVLKNAVNRIYSISCGLLTRYKEKNLDSYYNHEDKEPIFLPLSLKQLIMEKSYNAKAVNIEFKHNFDEVGNFVFIHVQPSSFQRAVSNIISNAIDAMPNGGLIEIRVELEEGNVIVKIRDHGLGIPREVLQKLKKQESVTHGKADGNGIGFTQVHDMLKRNYGKFKITTRKNKGTEISLIFKQVATPSYAIQSFNLKEDSIVVVVDDDPSIHGAWNLRFEKIKQDYPKLTLHHFEQGEDAIKYINQLSKEDKAKAKAKVMLLTDYELLGQKVNGLDVVLQTQMHNSVLVTSHFGNSEIIRRVLDLGIRLLPKDLSYEVGFDFDSTQIPQKPKTPQMLILGDDFYKAQTLCHQISRRGNIWIYVTPQHLIDCVFPLDKNIPIIIDRSDFKQTLDVAAKLNQYEHNHIVGIVKNKDALPTNLPDYLKVMTVEELLSKVV